MKVRIGCEQITWGPDIPPMSALADIAEAGYEGAPWDALDARPARDIEASFGVHGLVPAPGYLGGDFWRKDQRARLIETARRLGQISRDLGLSEIFISAGGFQTTTRTGRTRWEVAGNASPEDALSKEEFAQLVLNVRAIAEATMESGVRSCYHNHVGSFVETEDEIERLLADVEPELLALGPDTGHLAWAGIDVLSFVARHAERIRSMHLKDVDADVRDAGRNAGWDYGEFGQQGLWTEVGFGSVDFAGVLDVLRGAEFSGWLIVETDITQQPTPLASAKMSRAALRSLGI
jgi:inosose dehydratase